MSRWDFKETKKFGPRGKSPHPTVECCQILGLSSWAGKMKSVIVGEESSCLLQSAFKTRRGEGSDWPEVVCSFLMQLRIRNRQEETQKSSGLARAALIGSMLICDLKYIVNGAEYLAENLV